MFNDYYFVDTVTSDDAADYPELKPYIGYTMFGCLTEDNSYDDVTVVKKEDVNWLVEHNIDWQEFVCECSSRVNSAKIQNLYEFVLTDEIIRLFSAPI